MSLHSSLKKKGGLTGKRNVLKREERIAKLTDSGRIDPKKDTVLHLPKTLARS